ncbi:MAG TPA: GTP-binding protein [Clostridiales bacterium]|nr:GTP-binding protein [Clostridiales bacterium]
MKNAIISAFSKSFSKNRKTNAAGCHTQAQQSVDHLPKIMLIGTPNVGKSVIFNKLTGMYVTVSNYPGTTVEVSKGKGRIGNTIYGIIDTPGMYSMMPITDEERVTRNLILEEKPDVVLHVIDAKNLCRMLPMTLQLYEAGLPVILVLNVMDEAKRLGMKIDTDELERMLGIPVVATVAALNKGMDKLRERIIKHGRPAA